MAIIEEVNAVSHEYFDKTITQQVYEGSPFFKKLKADKRVRKDGGTQIQFPIRYQKLGHAKSTGFRTQVDYKSKETRTGGTLEWKKYDAETVLHHDEMLKNAGQGKIVSLIKDKSSELVEDLKDKMNSAIFELTQGVDDFVPLPVIIDSSGSYAGISPSDVSDWASVEDGSTTVLTTYGPTSLSKRINSATFGSHQPTLHITTRDGVSKFESLIDPQKQYEDKAMANIGFENVTFRKKPIVGDVFCPANYWFGIDMDQFELCEHSDEPAEPTDWFTLPQAGFPKAMAKYICWVGNIMCRMRRTSFKFTALDFTL